MGKYTKQLPEYMPTGGTTRRENSRGTREGTESGSEEASNDDEDDDEEEGSESDEADDDDDDDEDKEVDEEDLGEEDGWEDEIDNSNSDREDGGDADPLPRPLMDDTLQGSIRRDREEKCVEWLRIDLPSQRGWSTCVEQGLQNIAELELELRRGQANEALHQLHLHLAYKALLLRKTIRNVKSQKKSTRAWKVVHRMEGKAGAQVSIYRQARQALLALLPEEGESDKGDKIRRDVLSAYQEIEKAHLKMPGDITEEQRAGQKNDRLAWFWRFDVGKDMNDDTWLEECKRGLSKRGTI